MGFTLEWGVKPDKTDELADAIAAYGARTIYTEPEAYQAPRLDFVPGRTDHYAVDDATWKRLTQATNTLLRDLAEEEIYHLSMELKWPEQFYEPITLVDVGQFKVFAQRQRSYVNITFAMYDAPLATSDVVRHMTRRVERKRSTLFREKMEELTNRMGEDASIPWAVVENIWKRAVAEA